MKKVPTMTKEQTALLNQMLQMLGPGWQLGQGYGQSLDYQRQLTDPSSEAVHQFSEPYMQQFEQQTIPGLAERFAKMEAMGVGLSSSGFGQSLSSARGNLQSQLAALKSSLGQNAAQSLMGQYERMSGMGLSAQPFGYQRPQQSGMGGFLQAWGQAGYPGANQMGQGLENFAGKYMPIIGEAI